MPAFRWRPGGFYLGTAFDDTGAPYDAGIHDDRHLFIVAGSRGGKGRSLLLPNAATWPGGLVALDPKGELASITAIRRGQPEFARLTGSSVGRCLGQQVAILDPMGVVRGPARAYCVDYDPLSDLDIRERHASKFIGAITEALVIPEAKEAHFTDNAAVLIKGMMDLTKITMPPELHSLRTLDMLMLGGFADLEEKLRAVRSPLGLAPRAAAVLREVGAEEAGSFFSTTMRQLGWIADPDMQNHLRPSRFSLRQAVLNGASIYIVLPPEQMPDQKRWLRLIINICIHALTTRSVFRLPRARTLFLLDEFPVLERFQIIEKSAGYLAGYGAKIVPVIQNIGQLREHYDRNWETFLGNAGGICAFSLNDYETEEYISQRIGHQKVYNSDRVDNRNWTLHRTMRPEEVRARTARETMNMVMISAAGGWGEIRLHNYDFLLRKWGPLLDTPEYIEQWEERFEKHVRERARLDAQRRRTIA